MIEAATVFKPSNIKVECLDEQYRVSDDDRIRMNFDQFLHVLVGKEGEKQRLSVEEMTKAFGIVNINNVEYGLI